MPRSLLVLKIVKGSCCVPLRGFCFECVIRAAAAADVKEVTVQHTFTREQEFPALVKAGCLAVGSTSEQIPAVA